MPILLETLKKTVLVVELVIFVKVWFNRFVYGMYPDSEQWRINSAFIMLFVLVGASFLYLQN